MSSVYLLAAFSFVIIIFHFLTLMSWQKYAYNIFSPEGTLLPIEYALECVNNSTTILAYKTKDSVICIAKKPPHDKLQIVPKLLQQVTNNTYLLPTGYEPDLEIIKSYVTEAAFNLEYNMGYEPTANIIAREFADKIQNQTQKSGTRSFAFSAFIIGFEESENKESGKESEKESDKESEKESNVYLYYVDNSAVLVPVHAMAAGEHSSKVNGFFEKNVGAEDGLEISVEGMCQALGYDFGPNDIDMCVIDKNGIKWLDNNEVDDLLVKISEKN